MGWKAVIPTETGLNNEHVASNLRMQILICSWFNHILVKEDESVFIMKLLSVWQWKTLYHTAN